MYINCLPSHNWLLKFEHKQFAQLAEVSLLVFLSLSRALSFFFFFYNSLSTVCAPICKWRPQGSKGYVQCILLFGFPMVWWSFFSLCWLRRQSVYHMESVGRKTVSSVFLIGHPTPPHTLTHTINPPLCSPPPLSPLSAFLLPPPVSALSQLNLQNPMAGN